MLKKLLAKKQLKSIALFAVILSLFAVGSAYADGGSVPTIKDLSDNLSGGLAFVTRIIQYIAIIAGIGFVFGAFHKFHANKMNPTQVPLSQGVTMLLIGSALLVFPTLLETGAKMMVSGPNGQGFQQAKIGGDEINGFVVKQGS